MSLVLTQVQKVLLSLDAYNPAAIGTSHLVSSNNSGVYMHKAWNLRPC